MNVTGQNILKTLTYFNIFQYPLTKEEIRLFHCENISQVQVDESLETLCLDKDIFKLNGFFGLQDDLFLAERREKGNLLAIEHMKTARRAARILSKFPYVKGIAISGSLSKNFANEKTDIDFFIVTAANRLWIARTFMHLFKKMTFLAGKQHWFCMNYYVDEAAPEIEEKNVFTAMEVVTLVPLYGREGMDKFLQANIWVKELFPACGPSLAETAEFKYGFFKKAFEKVFNNRMGEWLDNLLMKITDRRWKKKPLKNLQSGKGIARGMMVGKHYSKPNPANFQDKVVMEYENGVKNLKVGDWKLELGGWGTRILDT